MKTENYVIKESFKNGIIINDLSMVIGESESYKHLFEDSDDVYVKTDHRVFTIEQVNRMFNDLYSDVAMDILIKHLTVNTLAKMIEGFSVDGDDVLIDTGVVAMVKISKN